MTERDRKRICDECGEREATMTVTLVDGESEVLDSINFCFECGTCPLTYIRVTESGRRLKVEP